MCRTKPGSTYGNGVCKSDDSSIVKCNDESDCVDEETCMMQKGIMMCVSDKATCGRLNDGAGCKDGEVCRKLPNSNDFKMCMQENRQTPEECHICEADKVPCKDENDCEKDETCAKTATGQMCVPDKNECAPLNGGGGCKTGEECNRQGDGWKFKVCMVKNRETPENCHVCEAKTPRYSDEKDCSVDESCVADVVQGYAVGVRDHGLCSALNTCPNWRLQGGDLG